MSKDEAEEKSLPMIPGKLDGIIQFLKENASDIVLYSPKKESLLYKPTKETLKTNFSTFFWQGDVWEELANFFQMHCTFPVVRGVMYTLNIFDYTKLNNWIKKNKNLFMDHTCEGEAYDYYTYFQVVLAPFLQKKAREQLKVEE
jgi:hypothetical protein